MKNNKDPKTEGAPKAAERFELDDDVLELVQGGLANPEIMQEQIRNLKTKLKS